MSTGQTSGDFKKQYRDRGPGFVCVFCDKHFSGTCVEAIHIRRHIRERPYNCRFCDYCAACASDVGLHERKHHPSKELDLYRCSKCSKTFKLPVYLENHFRTHHLPEVNDTVIVPPRRQPSSTCDYCGKSFRLSSTLATHRRTHTGERPYTCELCGMRFAQKSNYNVHVRRHLGDKRVGCKFCDKRFINNHNARTHMKAIHHYVDDSSSRAQVNTSTTPTCSRSADGIGESILPD